MIHRMCIVYPSRSRIRPYGAPLFISALLWSLFPLYRSLSNVHPSSSFLLYSFFHIFKHYSIIQSTTIYRDVIICFLKLNFNLLFECKRLIIITEKCYCQKTCLAEMDAFNVTIVLCSVTCACGSVMPYGMRLA